MSESKKELRRIIEEVFRCLGCNRYKFRIVFSKTEDKYWFICDNCGAYYDL
jgi:transcription elongation factor Elf1